MNVLHITARLHWFFSCSSTDAGSLDPCMCWALTARWHWCFSYCSLDVRFFNPCATIPACASHNCKTTVMFLLLFYRCGRIIDPSVCASQNPPERPHWQLYEPWEAKFGFACHLSGMLLVLWSNCSTQAEKNSSQNKAFHFCLRRMLGGPIHLLPVQ